MPPSYALLEDRGVLEIKGEDSRDFPQDLITADVDKAGPKRGALRRAADAPGQIFV